MSISLQEIRAPAFTLRHQIVGDYGDPYDFVCTVELITPTTAWISAGSGTFTVEIFREIKAKLLSIGVEHVEFERRGAGRAPRARHYAKDRE